MNEKLLKIRTLGELKSAGYQTMPVRMEMRKNLLERLRSKEQILPGIVGYEETVVPEIENGVLVMLNKYPYNNGHIMVAARRHVASPELLPRTERTMLSDAVAVSIRALREALHPDAFNVGANLGGAAGAGFADHMHWHVVPRWGGDVNFMPVLAATRVISQHLEETYDLLEPLFKTVGAAIS